MIKINAIHGGEIERLAREFNIKVTDLLDFSANINPASPPERVLERLKTDAQNIALLTRYPDLELNELREILAEKCGVNASNIIIANGGAALIDAAIRAVSPRNCLMPVPAFSEYERALRTFGCETSKFLLFSKDDFSLDVTKFCENLESTKPDFCIVNNPHNPSGAIVRREHLINLVAFAQSTKTTVLLDEAFIDYQPDESLTAFVNEFENLIVMRSVTKFYSIPALRVGYAVTNERLANKLNAQIPSWSVTTLAANAVCEVFKDENFDSQVRAKNETAKAQLNRQLAEMGIKVYPSAANFLLLELKETDLTAGKMFEYLLVNHKIIVRDCSSYDNLSDKFLRVAIRTKFENEKLTFALSDCLSNSRKVKSKSPIVSN